MIARLLGTFTLFFCGFIYAQCNLGNYTSVPNLSATSFPYFSPSSGITVTASTSGVPTLSNVSYSCNSQTFACASPAWWINSSTGVITLGFSCPISSFTVVINGTNQGEIITFSGNAGTTSLSNYCTAGFSTVLPNQLIDNITAATGTIITVNNPTGATQYQITHNGTGSGSRVSLLDCFVCASPFAENNLAFSASYRQELQDVKLDWQLYLQQDLDGFEIQHSLNGIDWQAIGNILATASSEYNFIHEKPSVGSNYYRLQFQNQDGNEQFSQIEQVNVAGLSDLAMIVPNPNNGQFELIATGRKGQLELTDILGKLVLRQNFEENAVLDLRNHPKGSYLLRIKDQYERQTVQRIVIE